MQKERCKPLCTHQLHQPGRETICGGPQYMSVSIIVASDTVALLVSLRRWSREVKFRAVLSIALHFEHPWMRACVREASVCIGMPRKHTANSFCDLRFVFRGFAWRMNYHARFTLTRTHSRAFEVKRNWQYVYAWYTTRVFHHISTGLRKYREPGLFRKKDN